MLPCDPLDPLDPILLRQRYVAEEGSKSAHCCFEASVIDITRLDPPFAICECFNMEDAELIAKLLNEKEGGEK